MEAERKKEHERERRRDERDAKMGDLSRDEDIFRRRAQEMREKERRRDIRRKDHDDIWKRRQVCPGLFLIHHSGSDVIILSLFSFLMLWN